jgi:hypothetical protein
MFRPEYLAVGVVLAIVAAFRPRSLFPPDSGANYDRRGEDVGSPAPTLSWDKRASAMLIVLAGMAVVIAPWTIRNQIELDRTVPISTGGGKALYVGTYLPADGEYQRVKAILVKRYEGRDLDPHSQALDEINPTPLFDRVAEERYPDLPRDSALGKIGKENFSDFFAEDPVGYAAMTVRKVGRMWSSGVGEAMSSSAGRVIQIALVALGIAGLVALGLRRRWWELAALGIPIALVTLVGAASLAAPRRNEVLMTLVFPLAGLALSWALAAISSGREWSPEQASSPPS